MCHANLSHYILKMLLFIFYFFIFIIIMNYTKNEGVIPLARSPCNTCQRSLSQLDCMKLYKLCQLLLHQKNFCPLLDAC